MNDTLLNSARLSVAVIEPAIGSDKHVLVASIFSKSLEIWNISRVAGTTRLWGIIDGMPHVTALFVQGNSAYVAEAGTHSVFKFLVKSESGSVLGLGDMKNSTTLVAGGSGVGRRPDQLFFPMGLHVDERENLFVADTYNHRVVMYGRAPNSKPLVLLADGIRFPMDVTLSSHGELYVADAHNHRVLQYQTRPAPTVAQCILGYRCSIVLNPRLLISTPTTSLFIIHNTSSCRNVTDQDLVSFWNTTGHKLANPGYPRPLLDADEYSFGVISHAVRETNYSLCWSHHFTSGIASHDLYAAGKLSIIGPMPSSFECTLSVRCLIDIRGMHIDATGSLSVVELNISAINQQDHANSASIIRGCRQPGVRAANWLGLVNPAIISGNATAFDLGVPIGGPVGMHHAVCWDDVASKSPGALGGREKLHVGNFTLYGPRQGHNSHCVIGKWCNITISMVVPNMSSSLVIKQKESPCAEPTAGSFVTWNTTVGDTTYGTKPITNLLTCGALNHNNQVRNCTFPLGPLQGGYPGLNYRMCWWAGDRPTHPVDVGRLAIHGPRPVGHVYCLAGATCKVHLVGFGLAGASRLALVSSNLPCHLAEGALEISGTYPSIVSSSSFEGNVTYDLGTLLPSRTITGRLCWASGADSDVRFESFSEVGFLTVTRPDPVSAECVVGSNCTVVLTGKGLLSSNHLLVTAGMHCGASEQITAAPYNNMSNPVRVSISGRNDTFEFGIATNRLGGSIMKLCWSPQEPPTGDLSSFVVDVGNFTMHGPDHKDSSCILGEECSVRLTGSGLNETNRILLVDRTRSATGGPAKCGSRHLVTTGFTSSIVWFNERSATGLNGRKSQNFVLGIPMGGKPALENYDMCWAPERRVAGAYSDFVYPVGRFVMSGPFRRVSYCMIRQACNISLEGIGLTSTNRILVIRDTYRCGQAVPFSGVLSTEGLVVPANVTRGKDGNWTHYSLGSPMVGDLNTYRVCWSHDPDSVLLPGSSRAYHALFRVELGTFHVVSVAANTSVCIVGQECVIDVYGVAFRDSNMVTVVAARTNNYAEVACGPGSEAAGPRLVSNISVPANSSNFGSNNGTYRNYSLGVIMQRPMGYLLRVCWAFHPTSSEPSEFREDAGNLILIGPDHVDTQCVLGEPCNIILRGVGLRPSNLIRVIRPTLKDETERGARPDVHYQTSCDSPYADPAQWQGMLSYSNTSSLTNSDYVYRMGTPTDGDPANTSYILCWQFAKDASRGMFRSIMVGRFIMAGPNIGIYEADTNHTGKLVVRGIGLRPSDRLIIVKATDRLMNPCGRVSEPLMSETDVWVDNGTWVSDSQIVFRARLANAGDTYAACWKHGPVGEWTAQSFAILSTVIVVYGPRPTSLKCRLNGACGISLQDGAFDITSNRLLVSADPDSCNGTAIAQWKLKAAAAEHSNRRFDLGRQYYNNIITDAIRVRHTPGTYSLCWAGSSRLDSYKYRAGEFRLQGPMPEQRFVVETNQSTSLMVRGFELTNSSRLIVLRGNISCNGTYRKSGSEVAELNPVPIIHHGEVNGHNTAEFFPFRISSVSGIYTVCWTDRDSNPFDVRVGSVTVEGPDRRRDFLTNVQELGNYTITGYHMSLRDRIWLEFATPCTSSSETLDVAFSIRSFSNVSEATYGTSAILMNIRLWNLGRWHLCWRRNGTQPFAFGSIVARGPRTKTYVGVAASAFLLELTGTALSPSNTVIITSRNTQCGASTLPPGTFTRALASRDPYSSSGSVSRYLVDDIQKTGDYRVCWSHENRDDIVQSVEYYRHDAGLLRVAGPALASEDSSLSYRVGQSNRLLVRGYFPEPVASTMRIVVSEYPCGQRSTTMTEYLAYVGTPAADADIKHLVNATWSSVQLIRSGSYYVCWCAGFDGVESIPCESRDGGESYAKHVLSIKATVDTLPPPNIISAEFILQFTRVVILFDAAIQVVGCVAPTRSIGFCECVLDTATLEALGEPTQASCEIGRNDFALLVTLGSESLLSLPGVLASGRVDQVTKVGIMGGRLRRKTESGSNYASAQEIALSTSEPLPKVGLKLIVSSPIGPCSELVSSTIGSVGDAGRDFVYRWSVECEIAAFCSGISAYFDASNDGLVTIPKIGIFRAWGALTGPQRDQTQWVRVSVTVSNFWGSSSTATEETLLIGGDVIIPAISPLTPEIVRASRQAMLEVAVAVRAGQSQSQCTSGSPRFGELPTVSWYISGPVSGSDPSIIDSVRKQPVSTGVEGFPGWIDRSPNPAVLMIPASVFQYNTTYKLLAVGYAPSKPMYNVSKVFVIQIAPQKKPIAVVTTSRYVKQACGFVVSACESYDPNGVVGELGRVSPLEYSLPCFITGTELPCLPIESSGTSNETTAYNRAAAVMTGNFSGTCDVAVPPKALLPGSYTVNAHVRIPAGLNTSLHLVSERQTAVVTVETESLPPVAVSHLKERYSPQQNFSAVANMRVEGAGCSSGGRVQALCLVVKFSEEISGSLIGDKRRFPARPGQVITMASLETTNTAEGQAYACKCDLTCRGVLEEGESYAFVFVVSPTDDALDEFREGPIGLESILAGECVTSLGIPCTSVTMESPVEAHTSTPFTIDAVPKSGKVEITPAVGEEFTTSFNIWTGGWVDEAPEDLELRLEYARVNRTGSDELAVGSKWRRLTDWQKSSASYNNLFLPAGEYVFRAWALDLHGSSAKAQVRLTVNKVSNLQVGVLNGVLSQAIAGTDTSATLNTVQALSLADTSSADTEEAKELTTAMLSATAGVLELMAMNDNEAARAAETLLTVVTSKAPRKRGSIRPTAMSKNDLSSTTRMLGTIFQKARANANSLSEGTISSGFSALVHTSAGSVAISDDTASSVTEAMDLDNRIRDVVDSCAVAAVDMISRSGTRRSRIKSEDGDNELEVALFDTANASSVLSTTGDGRRRLQTGLLNATSSRYNYTECSSGVYTKNIIYGTNRYYDLFGLSDEPGISENTILADFAVHCSAQGTSDVMALGSEEEVMVRVPLRVEEDKNVYLCTRLDEEARTFVYEGVSTSSCSTDPEDSYCICATQGYGVLAVAVLASSTDAFIVETLHDAYTDDILVVIATDYTVPMIAICGVSFVLSVVAMLYAVNKDQPSSATISDRDRFEFLSLCASDSASSKHSQNRNKNDVLAFGQLTGGTPENASRPASQPRVQQAERSDSDDEKNHISSQESLYRRAIPREAGVFGFWWDLLLREHPLWSWLYPKISFTHSTTAGLISIRFWLMVLLIWGWYQGRYRVSTYKDGLFDGQCWWTPYPQPETWEDRCLLRMSALANNEQRSMAALSDVERANYISLLQVEDDLLEQAWSTTSHSSAWSKIANSSVDQGFTDWLSMPISTRRVAAALGYGEDVWRNCDSSIVNSNDCVARFNALQLMQTRSDWTRMNASERAPWMSLGYSTYAEWTMSERPQLWRESLWYNLTTSQQASARVIGYSEDTWDRCGHKQADGVAGFTRPLKIEDTCAGAFLLMINSAETVLVAIGAELVAVLVANLVASSVAWKRPLTYSSTDPDEKRRQRRSMLKRIARTGTIMRAVSFIFTLLAAQSILLLAILGIGTDKPNDRTVNGTVDPQLHSHFISSSLIAMTILSMRPLLSSFVIALCWVTMCSNEDHSRRRRAGLVDMLVRRIADPVQVISLAKAEKQAQDERRRAKKRREAEEKEELRREIERTLAAAVGERQRLELNRPQPPPLPPHVAARDISLDDTSSPWMSVTQTGGLPPLPPPLRDYRHGPPRTADLDPYRYAKDRERREKERDRRARKRLARQAEIPGAARANSRSASPSKPPSGRSSPPKVPPVPLVLPRYEESGLRSVPSAQEAQGNTRSKRHVSRDRTTTAAKAKEIDPKDVVNV
ncbi:hypothetical protein FOL47_006072 [Perkinsus chesapeaki]|uniref:Uncharacterized protein n=1 Tax=Perkinsus chesapeaki TaxID=330153 RepID=A0A7J6LUQ9_PERCH|nr:hypothetical protein FOL47_006072 [Perkinsus chesapeaki]